MLYGRWLVCRGIIVPKIKITQLLKGRDLKELGSVLRGFADFCLQEP